MSPADRLAKLKVAGPYEYITDGIRDPDHSSTDAEFDVSNDPRATLALAWHDPAIHLLNWLMTGDETDTSWRQP